MIEPLRLTFVVACPVEHAFAVWTEQTSRWWPRSHTVTGEAGLEVVFEGRQGGRIFERTGTGTEVEWGEITAWEPPRRLGYLWHIRADRADATAVEITFSDQGDATTRVEIEHRGWTGLARGQPLWVEGSAAALPGGMHGRGAGRTGGMTARRYVHYG